MNKLIKEFAIEWAKYLDWDFPNDPTEYTFTSDSLSKFAALVAEEEREACAKIAQNFAKKWWGIHCATNRHLDTTRKAHDDFCGCDNAIRARGKNEN